MSERKTELVNFLLFTFHYLVLLISILIGAHQTLHPIGVRWRWRNWNFPGRRRRRTDQPAALQAE